jgi:hypothetical protein
MGLGPFGALAAVVGRDAFKQILRDPDVECAPKRAKDVNEIHCKTIAPSTRCARSGPFDSGCAQRSHERGLDKARVEWRP